MAWLRGTPEEAFGLLQTSDPERMQIVQSGLEKEYLGAGRRGEGDQVRRAGAEQLRLLD